MDRTPTDLLRLLAMAGVVLIHATNDAEISFHGHGRIASLDGAGALLNEAMRFCVPLFVLLSGYALAARGREKGMAPGLAGDAAFVRDRLLRLGLPYLCWSALYWLPIWLREGVGATGMLLARLPTTGGSYHLYFLPLLLYASLWWPLARRWPSWWWLAVLVPLHLAWSGSLAWLWSDGPRPPPVASVAPVLWLLWFHLGVCWALRPPPRLPRLPALALVMAAFTAMWWEYRWFAARAPEPGWYNHFQRLGVDVFSIAVWLAWCAWQPGAGVSEATRRRIAFWSGLSFLVFLVHVALLRPWEPARTGLTASCWPAAWLLTLAAAAAAAWAMHALLPWAWLRAALGLPARR